MKLRIVKDAIASINTGRPWYRLEKEYIEYYGISSGVPRWALVESGSDLDKIIEIGELIFRSTEFEVIKVFDSELNSLLTPDP